MLELISVSHVFTGPGGKALTALDHVSFSVPAGHLLAVIGAAGSGKSTLLSLLAGHQEVGGGTIMYRGKDTSEAPLHANEIGYVPASDDVLSPVLTVRESVMSALMLRVADQTAEQRVDRASHLLVGVGLENVATHRVSSLTLPQKRRLKLAVALVSDPSLVICDEFTDGLDAKSQSEMTALLKFTATDHPSRVVIHATQMAANLAAYDTVVILHEGHVCFHGPSRAVTHYFSIQAIEELYPRLAKRPASRWGESWMRHRDSYYDAFKLGGAIKAKDDEEEGNPTGHITLPANAKAKAPEDDGKPAPESAEELPPPPALPSVAAQAKHLILRRWSTFRRTQKEWLIQVGLTALAPAVAALLILPNDHYLSAVTSGDTSPAVLWPAAYTCAMGWFLMVVLTMAFSVRTAAREIASEWPVYHRERTGGLRPLAYLLGKLGFVLPVVLLQILLSALTVEVVTGGLPGFALARLLLLMVTGIAFTSLCLATSALSPSAERSHSRCWMLAFTNLILAGAVLGFPRVLGGVLHPFITAYYGWSGGMETLKDTPLYEPLTLFVRTWFPSPALAISVLWVHFALGVFVTLRGLKKRL
ncbi:ABC-type multidrug transport system, ATPase component [Prosthecobacter debontii]|uniref:ABC-type multidrug transport system, ATPase component n=1 Tax=Prosthecobacter debontii TaxID=48467 RepID=A0A1T4Z3X4_9BACT|nr:ATP-binding cassette domain-containing protein [Prosthecobacter debontii]SKB08573.1 ABC-type multidrug transport system, ATPase component [Prosthecobacter debontii]